MFNEEYISVIIPAYNCEGYIKETISSVLNQTYTKFEIVVVNDCSTDGTLEVLREIALSDDRIKVVSNDINLNVAETRNIGVQNASYDIIAFLDSDDLWESSKLEKQIEFLIKNSVDFVYTGYNFIDDDGEFVEINFEVPEKVDFKKFIRKNVINSSTVMIKKNLITSFPMEKSCLLEDFICWASILKNGHTAYALKEKLVKYRLANNSRSSKKLTLIKKQYKSFRHIGFNPITSLYYTFIVSINALRKYGFSKLFRRKKNK